MLEIETVSFDRRSDCMLRPIYLAQLLLMVGGRKKLHIDLDQHVDDHFNRHGLDNQLNDNH